jgi:rubrerythrin
MDIGSILLILALLLLVGLFIARPLLERKAVGVSQEDRQLSSLLAERDRLINALQELDFDHTLGKIPDADYPDQRASLLQHGAAVLRQIDQYNPQPTNDPVEARIEAAIAARRADLARNAHGDNADRLRQAASRNGDDELEAKIAARRRERQDKPAGFCPQCGRPIQKSDRFCPGCGASMA